MHSSETCDTARCQTPQVLPHGAYIVVPGRSLLKFRAKAFGLVWVRGSMPVVSGTFQANGGRLRGAGEVSASAVDTGLRARDWHLHTGHYLGTTANPKIRLSVENADLASGHGAGRLTIRGNHAPLDLELDSVQVIDGTVRLEAHGTIDRSPFGMLPPWCGVSRLVHVGITLVAEPASPQAD